MSKPRSPFAKRSPRHLVIATARISRAAKARRRGVTWVVALAAVIGLATLGVNAASADVPIPSIAGTVSSASGTPLAGIQVDVFRAIGPGGEAFLTTDSSGNFSTTGLSAGLYSVSFYDPTSQYASQEFNNVAISDGATTIQNATLVPGYTLDGQVTDSTTGDPVAGVTVTVLQTGGGWVRTAITDGSGHYSLTQLQSSPVNVSAGGPPTAYESFGESSVDISGTSPELDFSLTPVPTGPGTIHGVVYDKLTNQPIDGASVSAYIFGISGYTPSTTTDVDGAYSFTNVPDGQVNLSVSKSSYRFSSATVSISDSAPSKTHDFYLTTNPTGTASISGTVTESDGTTPIPNLAINVESTSFDSSQSFSATTNAQGEYTVTGLPAGSYSVTDFNSEYVSPDYRSSIVAVPTSTSAVTKNFSLQRYLTGTGSVHGVLTDSRTGSPIAGASVSLYPESPDLQSQATDIASQSATTNQNGEWSITNLPDATYGVFISNTTPSGSYSYPDGDPGGEFPDLVISNGAHVERTDTLQSVVTGTASLTGRVRDAATHLGISGVQIALTRSLGGFDVTPVTSATGGAYTITGLPAGEYYATVSAPGYQSAYVDVVMAAAPVSFNISLTPGPVLPAADGTITGTVVDEHGQAVDGADVSVSIPGLSEADQPSSLPFATTDSDGHFELDQVPLTTVSVSADYYPFDDQSESYAPAVQTVDLSAANENSDLSFALVPGSSISGTVSVDGGTIPSDELVNVRDASTGDPVGFGQVNSQSGAYIVNGLAAGNYILQFEEPLDQSADAPPTSAGQAYWVSGTPYGSTSLSDATVITVGSGASLSGHDMSLHSGGEIHGTVQIQTSSGPVTIPSGKVVNIDIYREDGSNSPALLDLATGEASAYNNGQFTLWGLAPGNYALKFSDPYQGNTALTTQYSGGADSLTGAAQITVSAGGVTNIGNVVMSTAVPDDSPDAVNSESFSADQLDGLQDQIATDPTITAGDPVTVNVGADLAGQWVAVWANSVALPMSTWVQVAADGTVQATVPSTLSGSHRVVVEDASQQPVGWTAVTVLPDNAPVPNTTAIPPKLPTSAGPSTSQSTTNSATSTGSSKKTSSASSSATEQTTPAETQTLSSPTPTPTPIPEAHASKPSQRAHASTGRLQAADNPGILWIWLTVIALILIAAAIAFAIRRRRA